MSHQADDVAVLNALQTNHSDLNFAKGLLALAGSASDAFKDGGIPVKDITGYTFTAYTAGVVSQKDYDFTGVALVGDHEYAVNIIHNGISRKYSVIYAVGSEPADEDEIVTDLAAKIAADTTAAVTANDDAKSLDVTLKATELLNGDFTSNNTETAGETITIAFVAPSGTALEVEDQAGKNGSVVGETYDKYEIFWDRATHTQAVSGLKVLAPRKTTLYIAITTPAAARVTDIEAALDNILAGDVDWQKTGINVAGTNAQMLTDLKDRLADWLER